MNLLSVFPFSTNDAIQLEALLDFIAAQRNKTPRGAALLVAYPDVHGEMQTKLRIAAEIGFESVEVLPLTWQKVPQTSKSEAINQIWNQMALHISQTYRTPFVVIEPDAVPLKPDWCEVLAAAYENNPKRYLGAFLKGADERLWFSRVGVYPPGAIADIGKWCLELVSPPVYAKVPFEILAGEELTKRATKSRLIQQLSFTSNTPRDMVRKDAVLLHPDKEGVLLSQLRDELLVKPEAKPSPFDLNTMIAMHEAIAPIRRGPGRPKKVQEAVHG